MQVWGDRLRPQRLKRAPAAVDQRLADRKGGLTPAVLGELAVQARLDVATRQLAHGDVAEVWPQVDLELALHVSQAIRAQPLADLALVVLVGELPDRRDVALDVFSLQPRAPRSGEDLAGDQPCLVFGTCTGHSLVAAPEVDRLGWVAAAAEPHAVAHHPVAGGVLADLPGRLAGHTSQIATAEDESASRRSTSRPSGLASRGPTAGLAAVEARRRFAALRPAGCAAVLFAPARA
jgi:hypothetical protein